MVDEAKFQRLLIDDTPYETRLTGKYGRRRAWQREDPRRVAAFLPSVVVKVLVAPGRRVRCGDPLLVLEAMKMQNSVLAPHEGVIKTVCVKPGEKVAKAQLLVEFE